MDPHAGDERTAHVVNVEQAAAWNGDDGTDWTEHEEQYNATMRRHTRRLIDAALIAPTDRILDIGCGCGETTRLAAWRAPDGWVFGVDLSARMLARARERSQAEGLTNVTFEQADAQVYPFEAEAFDLVLSRFGVMFFGNPVAAFQNVRRALRPGGRAVFLVWQPLARNEWMSSLLSALAAGRDLPSPKAGSPGPFGLADSELTRHMLTAAGFETIDLADVSEPVQLGTDGDDAFDFVRSLGLARGMLRDLDPDSRTRALDDVRATIARHETGQGVLFGSAAWLVTAHRP